MWLRCLFVIRWRGLFGIVIVVYWVLMVLILGFFELVLGVGRWDDINFILLVFVIMYVIWLWVIIFFVVCMINLVDFECVLKGVIGWFWVVCVGFGVIFLFFFDVVDWCLEMWWFVCVNVLVGVLMCKGVIY